MWFHCHKSRFFNQGNRLFKDDKKTNKVLLIYFTFVNT